MWLSTLVYLVVFLIYYTLFHSVRLPVMFDIFIYFVFSFFLNVRWVLFSILGVLLSLTFLMKWPWKVTSWLVLCGTDKGTMLASLCVSWMTASVKGRFFLSSTCTWRLPITLLSSSRTWSGRKGKLFYLGSSFNDEAWNVCLCMKAVHIYSSLPCIVGYLAISRSVHLSVDEVVSVPAPNKLFTVITRFSLWKWLL